MPTGHCRYPGHHSPSAGPPAGIILALIAGALIITHVREVIVTLVVVAVLGLVLAGAVMLWHPHRSAPYDAAWTEPEDEPVRRQAVTAGIVPDSQLGTDQLRARVARLERQLAERQAIAPVDQHLHIHGVSADDVAAIAARHAAIERQHGT